MKIEQLRAENERLRAALKTAMDNKYVPASERYARQFAVAAALTEWSDTRTIGEAWDIIAAATASQGGKK